MRYFGCVELLNELVRLHSRAGLRNGCQSSRPVLREFLHFCIYIPASAIAFFYGFATVRPARWGSLYRAGVGRAAFEDARRQMKL